jgi:hypothetical protein
MHNLKKLHWTGALLCIVLIQVLHPAAVSFASASSCGQWRIVPSPNPGGNSQLNGIAAVSRSDVWAVGYENNGAQPVTEHWNGTKWKVVSSPAGNGSALFGVTAVSATDVWAVGYTRGSAHTLTEHWDGMQWAVVPSANVTRTNFLLAVAAVSATDVWAVGQYYQGKVAYPLTEHWNGTKWKVVKSPSFKGVEQSVLDGVSVVSSNDVWAVGYSSAPQGVTPLTEHWNGTQWQIVPNSGTDELLATTAIDASDVWAVGTANSGTLTERWDGQQWENVPGPTGESVFRGVAASGADAVWAVGENFNGQMGQTLIANWNGQAWQVVSSPNVPGANDRLFAVTTVSRQAWAVGVYYAGDKASTLIEYYC